MSPGNCPTGCGRNADPGKLMCPSCWSQVPRFLQNNVLKTWAAYRKAHRQKKGLGTTEDHARIREARLAYQAARDAAVTAVP